MKYYPFAVVALMATSPATRDRFVAMTQGNRMCDRKAPAVLAAIEGRIEWAATK